MLYYCLHLFSVCFEELYVLECVRNALQEGDNAQWEPEHDSSWFLMIPRDSSCLSISIWLFWLQLRWSDPWACSFSSKGQPGLFPGRLKDISEQDAPRIFRNTSKSGEVPSQGREMVKQEVERPELAKCWRNKKSVGQMEQRKRKACQSNQDCCLQAG